MKRQSEIKQILEEIREGIQRSDLSQRQVEKRAGFSNGYLSQLLAQNLDLKVWHVLAILDALGRDPGEFFHQLYPARRPPALQSFSRASRPLTREMDRTLDRLYGLGVDSLSELRGRLARCERAVADLETAGIVAGRRDPGEG